MCSIRKVICLLPVPKPKLEASQFRAVRSLPIASILCPPSPPPQEIEKVCTCVCVRARVCTRRGMEGVRSSLSQQAPM